MVASAIAGAAIGGIASSAIGASAAGDAADAQTQAANQANQLQRDQYAQTREDLAPYRERGQLGLEALTSRFGLSRDANGNLIDNSMSSDLLGRYPGYQNFAPTMEQLVNQPGYQFQLDQGLKAVTNANAAKGLVGSGAHGRGLIDYAEGLASTNYQTALDNYMKQYQLGFQTDQAQDTNIVNRLLALTGIGQQGAQQTTTAGIQTAGQIGSNIIGAGNASAAGSIGVANAISGGLSGLAGAGTNLYFANMLLGNQGGGGAAAPSYGGHY